MIGSGSPLCTVPSTTYWCRRTFLRTTGVTTQSGMERSSVEVIPIDSGSSIGVFTQNPVRSGARRSVSSPVALSRGIGASGCWSASSDIFDPALVVCAWWWTLPPITAETQSRSASHYSMSLYTHHLLFTSHVVRSTSVLDIDSLRDKGVYLWKKIEIDLPSTTSWKGSVIWKTIHYNMSFMFVYDIYVCCTLSWVHVNRVFFPVKNVFGMVLRPIPAKCWHCHHVTEFLFPTDQECWKNLSFF